LNQPSWPALVSSAEPEALQHHGQRGFFYFNYEGLRHRQKLRPDLFRTSSARSIGSWPCPPSAAQRLRWRYGRRDRPI